MGTQIFNNPYNSIESWSAQGAVLQWAVGDGDPMNSASQAFDSIPLVAVGLQMQYQQQVQSYYPINADVSGEHHKINVKGAPNGTLIIESIYSPTHANLKQFIEAVTKDCKTPADQVTFSIRPFGELECTNSDTIMYLTGVDCTSIGMNIRQGEVAVVSMPLQFTFAGLEWEF